VSNSHKATPSTFNTLLSLVGLNFHFYHSLHSPKTFLSFTQRTTSGCFCVCVRECAWEGSHPDAVRVCVSIKWVWVSASLAGGWMGCMVSQLAAKFAFFPPSPPTYHLKKRDDGKLTVVSTAAPIPHPDDTSLDVLLVDTKHGNKIVAFYLRNPYARLTLLYSHGNAADLGQLYDLFVQLKVNLRVNLMGLVVFW